VDTVSLELRILQHKGEMMPPNGLDILKGYEAIFLGAVGYPGVPDHVSLWDCSFLSEGASSSTSTSDPLEI